MATLPVPATRTATESVCDLNPAGAARSSMSFVILNFPPTGSEKSLDKRAFTEAATPARSYPASATHTAEKCIGSVLPRAVEAGGHP